MMDPSFSDGRSGCGHIGLSGTAALFLLICTFPSPVDGQEEEFRRERFIPANELESIFERTPNGVVLPREEFEELLQKAERAKKSAEKIPVATALRLCEYRIQQNGNHARIELVLDVEQFLDDWVVIDIPIGNLNLENAQIGDQPALISRPADSRENLRLAHNKSGRYQILLSLSAPLGTVGSDRVTAFRTVPDCPCALEVSCPADRLLILNDLQLQRPAAIEQETTYSIPGGSFDEVRLKWTTRRQETDSQSLVFAKTNAAIAISETNLRWESTTRVSVFGNAINELSARVPRKLEITSVESTGLEAWRLEDDPNHAGYTRVILTYRQPFTDDRLIQLTAVRSGAKPENAELPTLQFAAITSHTGRLLVRHDEKLRLMSFARNGIRQIGSATEAESGGGEVFDFWLQDFRLAIGVRPRDRELFAEVNSFLNFTDTQATFKSQITIESMNAPLFELPVRLPAGWQISEIRGMNNSNPKWRNSSKTNSVVIEPQIPTPDGGLLGFEVILTRTIDDPSNLTSIEIPVIAPENALLVGGTYSISAAVDLTVSPVEINGLAPIGDDDGQMLFETQGTSYSGNVTVQRKPVRIASRAVLRSYMDLRRKVVDIDVTVDIQNGTTRTLELQTPAELGTQLRFSVQRITKVPGCDDQQVPDRLTLIEQYSTPSENGGVAYRLTFDKRFVGSVTLRTSSQSARGNDDVISAPFIRVTDAVRQQGLVVFEAESDQLIVPPESTAASGLIIADAGLIEPPSQDTGRRVALVYRYVQPEYSMELTESRFSTAAVPSAVCYLLSNVSLLNEGEKLQRSSDVRFRCVGVQTLRFALPNPDTSYLWSTILNGNAVEVRRDGTDYLVSIPTDAAKTDHHLEILFETSGHQASLLGHTSQESISLSIDTDDGSTTPVDVLEQTWDIHYPASSMLLNHAGGFQPTKGVDSAGRLKFLMSLLTLPNASDIPERGLPIVIVLLVLFVLTVLISARRWRTLLAIGAAAAVAWAFLLTNSTRYNATSRMATMDASTSPGVQTFNGTDAGGDRQTPGSAAIGSFESSDDKSEAPQEMGKNVEDVIGLVAPADEMATLQGESAGQQVKDADETASVKSVEPQRKSGSARLSVRARVARPDDFQSIIFRSIGSTSEAGALETIVQPRTSIAALQLAAAAILILMCLMLLRFSTNSKLTFVTIFAAMIVASVPFLPNEWQSLPDGAASGLFLGVCIWLISGCYRVLTTCCVPFCRKLLSGKVFRRSVESATLLVWCCLVPTSTLNAQNAEKSTPSDVVLPYIPGQPELMADRVFIPQDQFLELYRKAYPERLGKIRSPIGSHVLAAFYKSDELRQVEGADWSQRFVARYVIHSVGKGPQTITLPIGQVAVASAELNGQPTGLITRRSMQNTNKEKQIDVSQKAQQQIESTQQPKTPADGEVQYSVLIQKTGLNVVDVRFDVAADVQGQVGRFELPLKPVAMGTLSLKLPAADLEAAINGRTDTYRQEEGRLLIPVDQSGNLRVDWSPRTQTNHQGTTYHAAVTSALSIDDQGLTLESLLDVTCRQGELAEIAIRVPSDYAVRSVTGIEIAGWRSSDSEPGNLKVLFKQPIAGKTKVRITLFRRLTVGSQESRLVVPVPSVPGSSRDSGRIVVKAGRELEIRVDALSGVSQINATDVRLPEELRSTLPAVLAWRYTRQPVKIGIRVVRDADTLRVTSLSGVQLESQRQLWTTLVSARISGSPRRRLEIELPDDYLALDVSANHLSDWYYSESQKADTKLLNVQFNEAIMGVVNIVVQGQTARRQDESVAALRPPVVIGSDEVVSTVSTWLDAASEISSVTAEDWKRVGQDGSVDPRILKLQSDTPDITFQTTDNSGSPITLSLRQAEASLAAESVTITTVTDTAVELTLGLNWNISGAATRSVSFSIPTSLADVYDFQVPGLRRLEKEENGEATIFTIHLQQPVSERLFILGMGTLPLPESREITPQQPRFLAQEGGASKVNSQSHFWVIVNQSPGLLQPVATESSGVDTSADEIRITMPPDLLEQAVAIKRLRAESPVIPWRLTFPTQQQVSPAVVALAAHTTIIADDASWRSRHILQVRNEARQFLSVDLPDDCRVLFCLVDNRPTRIVARTVGDQLLHLIPIPQSGELSAPFNVQFSLSGQLQQPGSRLEGTQLKIPCPIIPSYRDYPDYGVTVSRNTWQVYVPASWSASVVDDPRKSNMISATEYDLEDTVLLSEVDNLKSIINAAGKAAMTDNRKLAMEIEKQRILLRSLGCNDVSLEAQRAEVLQEADSLWKSLGMDPATQSSLGMQQMPDSSLNLFLDQQAFEQNGYNQRNSLNLIMGNTSEGIVSGDSASSFFNFTLPESAERQTETSSDPFRIRSKDSGQPEFAPQKEKAGKSGNVSRLLQRRDSNRESQSLRLKNSSPGNQQMQGQFDPQAFGSFQQSFPPQNGVRNAGGGFGGNQSGPPPVNAPALIMMNEQPQAANDLGRPQVPESAGVLSLTFEIPEDGTRLDFVRTGGNVSLSLNVRSRQTVEVVSAVVWGLVCLATLLFILAGRMHGIASVANRLLLTMAVIGIAGWFCGPSGLRNESMLLFVVASVVICCIHAGTRLKNSTAGTSQATVGQSV